MDDTPTAEWFAHFEGEPWAHGLRRFAARARRGAGFDPTREERGAPPEWGPHHRPPFGGPRFGRFGGFFGPFGPGSGRGPRMRRGDVRAAILALLREQPRNGYQIIQEIERRSSGLWKPSAGSVYPALQQLEDEGLIEAVEDAGRREFRLTDAGRTYADEHPDELAAPWASVAGSIDEDSRSLFEIMAAVGAATIQVGQAGSDAQVAKARQLLADTRKGLYRILAEEDPETPPPA
ncbi:MAG: PadR family transcriptional regulator [Candidatus Dormiibacterota bacterium]